MINGDAIGNKIKSLAVLRQTCAGGPGNDKLLVMDYIGVKPHDLLPVSSTHLDVYKRQEKYYAM